jgi:riboflavin synthase
MRLTVDPGSWAHRAEIGDSISVGGCCLTVAEVKAGGAWDFDAVPETLSKTALGSLRAGSRVNLEHAATPTTLLGGHIVQGHVDGVAEVVAVEQGPEYRVRMRPPASMMEFIAPKGSVCLDGVSLTVAALDAGAGWFEVALIPVTLQKTTLGGLKAGDRCNFEADSMAKTIVHWLKHFAPK